MMKKLTLKFSLLILSSFLLIVNVSCKKGEDDPAFSFKSRQSRLLGSWKLTKGQVKVTYPLKSGYGVQTYNFTESDYTHVVGGTGKFAGPHSISLLFSEDGTFEVSEKLDTLSFTAKGRWDFFGKRWGL